MSITNIEYGWNPTMKTSARCRARRRGARTPAIPCGTMVAGVLVAGDNGYGLAGLVQTPR